MKHKHHIIPRHEGGSDFAENIVELTVTQHAMWHFAEWKRKENWQDRVAWQGLSKMITKEEAISKARIEGAQLGGSRSWLNMTKEQREERIEKMNAGKGSHVSGYKWSEGAKERRRGSGNPMFGRTRTEEEKRKTSEARKKGKWWTNGETTKFGPNCPGDGWVRGRKLR